MAAGVSCEAVQWQLVGVVRKPAVQGRQDFVHYVEYTKLPGGMRGRPSIFLSLPFFPPRHLIALLLPVFSSWHVCSSHFPCSAML